MLIYMNEYHGAVVGCNGRGFVWVQRGLWAGGSFGVGGVARDSD